MKTPGQLDYERDVQQKPLYHDERILTMNTAKHTPGPICTCGIITTVVDTGIGCYDENKIAQCELCAAAPAMYEALQQSLVLVKLAALEEWGRAVRGEQQPPTTEAKDRLEKVKAALAQAEGTNR